MAKNKPTNKIVNFKRNNLKTPRNKIVPTDDSITTEKSLQRKIDNIEKKIIQKEVKKADIVDKMRDSIQEGRDAVRKDRKKFRKNLLKNRLNLKSKFKKSPPTIRWTPSDDPFDKKIGWGKTTYGRGKEASIFNRLDRAQRESLRIIKDAKNKIKSGPRVKVKWRPMKNTHSMLIDAFHTGQPDKPLSSDNQRIWDAYSKWNANEWRKWKRKYRETNRNRLERIEEGRIKQAHLKTIKGTLGTSAAYIVADLIHQKYLDPLAKKIGTKAGRYIYRKTDEIEEKVRNYLKSRSNEK